MSNQGDAGANGAEAIQQVDSGANLNVNDSNDAALPALAAPARQALAARITTHQSTWTKAWHTNKLVVITSLSLHWKS